MSDAGWLYGKLDRIRDILPEDCYIFRANHEDLSCVTFVGNTVEIGSKNGHHVLWTEEMCCLPCRIRMVIDA